MLKYGLGEWVCERVCGVEGIVRTVAKELVEGRMRVFGESEGMTRSGVDVLEGVRGR